MDFRKEQFKYCITCKYAVECLREIVRGTENKEKNTIENMQLLKLIEEEDIEYKGKGEAITEEILNSFKDTKKLGDKYYKYSELTDSCIEKLHEIYYCLHDIIENNENLPEWYSSQTKEILLQMLEQVK